VTGAFAAPVAVEGREEAPQFRSADVGAGVTSEPIPAPTREDGVVPLSDEHTLSRWAWVNSPTNVHANPSSDSRVIGRVETETFHRTPELVLALAEVTSGNETWVEVRFKVRPNNQTGWVNRSQLGKFNVVDKFLKIQRGRMRATLYKDGKRIWRARIGIGQSRWPTPAGHFFARERLVPIDTNGVYGVFAIGTSATSPVLTDWPGGGIIGIHGTNQPELIPGRISHGCIRVRNGKIEKLRRLMPLGTPIEID
jgi:lipoprotein-anchoring transpeptidase ErfK/SrfK